MKIKASIASVLILASILVSLGSNGCSDDDDKNDIASRTARKGEACQTTRDCAPGLACMEGGNGNGSFSYGGTCVLGTFNVAPTNKECEINECVVANDCCSDPPSYCEGYRADCELHPGSDVCETYQRECVCDESRRSCEAGKCVVTCADDQGCTPVGGTTTSNSKCIGGKCGECSNDTDCKDTHNGDETFTCVNAKCKSACQGDGDCAGFERCLNGKCIDGGCQSTRECIASTRNVEATCGTDGKCIIPCQTDLECGNPTGYSFFSCVSNQCVYVGCDTDKDCRLFVCGVLDQTGTSTSSGGSSSGDFGACTSPKEHIVCRAKTTPGALSPP